MADEKKKHAKSKHSGKPCKVRYKNEMRWLKNKRRRMLKRLRGMVQTESVIKRIASIQKSPLSSK